MLAVFIFFGLVCAFIAYAPEEVTKAALLGSWVLILLGTIVAVAMEIIGR